MKTKLIIFTLCFLGCNANRRDYSNIEVTNMALVSLIKKFQINASPYRIENSNIISVSIWINHNDTNIGLYADKKLKAEYFIGYLQIDSQEVYFYSNYKKSIHGFYKIKSKPKIGVDSAWDYRETYSEHYRYSEGNFR